MQLQDIRFTGQRLVEAYGDGGFRFSDRRLEGSVLILPGKLVEICARELSDLTDDLLSSVFAREGDVEIMILGTGKTHIFPPVEMSKKFIEHKIALETMDTGAACRTYNILVSEDRQVAAALIAVE